MRHQWMASLHGGHSGEFCGHAEGTLREMLDAAVVAGYTTFGVSEHAPRVEERFLYEEERADDWTVPRLETDFERYAEAIQHVARDYGDRLTVLRGFEAEVIPTATYRERMRSIRSRTLADGSHAFDYCVGSVHYVEEKQIDGPPEALLETTLAFGGLEATAVRYYEHVTEMVTALRPEVVGHLDLIKKNVVRAGLDIAELSSERVRRAADQALEAVMASGAILDLNTAGWRKGLGEPYPSAWLITRAHEMGISFCFGDDSHRASDVGAGVAEARELLLKLGIEHIAVPSLHDGVTAPDRVSLID